MASNINVVVLSGNLTKDPELRTTHSGKAVCELRLAVNGRVTDAQGEWQDKPNFFNVKVWGRQGESCANYLTKGRAIMVDGRLDWREWETQAGEKRQTVEVIAENIQFGARPEGAANGAAGGHGQPERREPVGAGVGAGGGSFEGSARSADDDIPF